MKTKKIINGVTYFSKGYVDSKLIIAKNETAIKIFKDLNLANKTCPSCGNREVWAQLNEIKKKWGAE